MRKMRFAMQGRKRKLDKQVLKEIRVQEKAYAHYLTEHREIAVEALLRRQRDLSKKVEGNLELQMQTSSSSRTKDICYVWGNNRGGQLGVKDDLDTEGLLTLPTKQPVAL